jgi:AAA+ ATPase superfamily predicted ATPase
MAGRMFGANPFTATGVAVGEHFADRAGERAMLQRSLATAPAFLLLRGDRRIGKSSLLQQVERDLVAKKKPVIYIDLWTASTPSDVVTRLITGAATAIGRSWRDVAFEYLDRLQLKAVIQRSPDGHMAVVPALSLRDKGVPELAKDVSGALAAIEVMAAAKRRTIGVMIDEFQEIATLFGPDVFRQIRAEIQRHQHVSYVFSGSEQTTIDRLLTKDQALYKLLQQHTLGPLPGALHARWLEQRIRTAGMKPEAGVGARIIALAGPRTWDVRQLAFWSVEVARGSSGRVTKETAEQALALGVRESQPAMERFWAPLSVWQKQMLRALTRNETGLTSKAVLVAHGFESSSVASKALTSLVEMRVVVKTADGRYVFDDPFVRIWVATYAMSEGEGGQ